MVARATRTSDEACGHVKSHHGVPICQIVQPSSRHSQNLRVPCDGGATVIRAKVAPSDCDQKAGVFMNPHPNVYARLERVKTLWAALSKTPTKSKAYQVLADEIRTEAAAYLAGINAAIAVDRGANGLTEGSSVWTPQNGAESEGSASDDDERSRHALVHESRRNRHRRI